MKKYLTICFIALFLFNGATLSGCRKNPIVEVSPVELPKLFGILSTLKIEHPRLLLTDVRLQELKTLSNTDTRLKKYAADVVAQADKDIFKSPIQHVLIGPRLLDKSREYL